MYKINIEIYYKSDKILFVRTNRTTESKEVEKMILTHADIKYLESIEYVYYYVSYNRYVVFAFNDEVYSRRLYSYKVDKNMFYFRFKNKRINISANQLHR